MHRILLVALVISLYQISAKFINNHHVVVEQCTPHCKGSQSDNLLRNVKYEKVNRTYRLLSYDYTLIRPLDDQTSAIVIAEKWTNGGWKQIPFIPEQRNVCATFLKILGDLWIDAMRRSGVKHPDRCPIPSGNYSLRNYHVDTSLMTMPLWPGRFKGTIMFRDAVTNKMFFCLETLTQIDEVV